MRLVFIVSLATLTSCSYPDAKPVSRPDTAKGKSAHGDSVSITTQLPKGLIGKWVKVLKTGKRYIEISSTSDISVYNIATNGRTSDTLKGNLVLNDFGYTPVEMQFPSMDAIFYYRWKQDTLIYFDEAGERERYVKQH